MVRGASSRLVADLDYARFVVVSGKGGCGKSTVAAALGVALAHQGKKVLLVQAGQATIPRLFGMEPNRDWSRPVTSPVAGLFLIRLVAWRALSDFGPERLGSATLVRRLLRSRRVRGFLEGLPGLAGLALLGRAWHYTRSKQGGGHPFDVVILETTGLGHVVRLLSQPGAVASILPDGVLRRDLEELDRVVLDRRSTKIVVVTLAEEYAVAETKELCHDVAASLRPVDLVVANRVLFDWLDDCPSGSAGGFDPVDLLSKRRTIHIRSLESLMDLGPPVVRLFMHEPRFRGVERFESDVSFRLVGPTK